MSPSAQSMNTLRPGSAYHEELARGWSSRYGSGAFQRRFEFIGQRLGTIKIRGQRWLDAGCGSGVFARLLASMGASVVAFDGSPAMLAEARATEPETASSIEYELIDSVEQLPLDDDTMDGAISLSVIEYLANPQACIRELARVLRPGGFLVATVPNNRSLTRLGQQAIRTLGGLLGRDWCSYLSVSKNAFSKRGFAARLSDEGFEIVSTGSFAPYWAPVVNPLGMGGLWVVVARKPGSLNDSVPAA